MRRLIYLLIVLGCIINSSIVFAQSHSGDKVDADNLRGMTKGAIYFMPENEIRYIPKMLESDLVCGAEIYTTWGAVEKSEGVYDWSYIDDMIERFRAAGKSVALRIATTNFSINDSPDYLYTKYDVRRIVPGYWENFESKYKGYIIHAEISSQSPIAGQKSIRMSASKAKAMIETGVEQRFILDSGIVNPTHNTPVVNWVKRKSKNFCLQFDYRSDGITDFYVKAYSKSNPKMIEYKQWRAYEGEKGMKTFTFSPKSDDYKVEIGLVCGDLTLDNVMICDMVSGYHFGTLCFPNFFDPKFKERYEIFVKAFALKYNKNKTLNSICVGGYGRWEEITLSDEHPGVFEDQWPTFGYSNEAYIDHVRWCIDTYKKYFTTQNLYTGAVGWSNDWFRDQVYIDWKVATYAASKGVGIKYNGWQHVCSEWGTPAVGFFYAINRYRHDKNVWTMFEEGGQVDSHDYMGHPLSLFNKAVLENIDYCWIYPNDLSEPIFQRYEHYANEMAGAAVITKMYNQFGNHRYSSPKAGKELNLRNIWLGLFQKDNILEPTLYTFVEIDGQKAVQTNDNQRAINMSIDDRARYNAMYGALLSIDYLDAGSDSFKVFTKSFDGFAQVTEITKSNSGEWKTLYIQNGAWATKVANSGVDDLVEIIVDDLRDGVETLRAMEINYVPARDWQQRVVSCNELDTSKQLLLNGEYMFDIHANNAKSVSGIEINVSAAQKGYVNINAKILSYIDDAYVLAAEKDYYLPEGKDWFDIPVANMAMADKYRVVVKCTEGSAYLNLGKDGKPAFRTYSFIEQTNNGLPRSEDIEALYPFFALKISVTEPDRRFVLKRQLPSGQMLSISEVRTDADGIAYIEPQSAGHYRMEDASGAAVAANAVYLKRLPEAKSPVRNLRGEHKMKLDNVFLARGWINFSNDNTGFHATLNTYNQSLITDMTVSFESDAKDQFRFVMKNQTGSSLAKLCWRTDNEPFNEINSVLIAIVPNDEYYREYTFPIGMESGWKGRIAELKFIPVFGHTDAGALHINTVELRNGDHQESTFGELLNVRTTNFTIKRD